jgi:hypothetical protein
VHNLFNKILSVRLVSALWISPDFANVAGNLLYAV